MTGSTQRATPHPELDGGGNTPHATASSPPPVGVRLLRAHGEHADRPVYHGVSYCDAVRRAGEGEVLRVLPGSIEVCGWAPVVLGLKEPQGRFEEGLAPRLAFPVAGLLLAPLERFPGQPDAVLVRARPEVLREMIAALGPEGLWNGGSGPRNGLGRQRNLDRTAIPCFAQRSPLGSGGTAPRQGLVTARRWLVGSVNRALAALARYRSWQALTHWLFRSRLVTAGFDALISRTLADMSVCRNSTAIPLLTGQVNLSFFCTGGITWGRNHPEYLTSGWPWPAFQQAAQSTGLPTGQPASQPSTHPTGKSP